VAALGETTLEIKKGSMCFTNGRSDMPVAYKTITGGPLTTVDNLMCLSKNFDFRNPLTFALCGKDRLCSEYGGRAYCARVVTKSTPQNEFTEVGKFGFVVTTSSSALENTQFCLPHQKAERVIGNSYTCRSSGTGPTLSNGQICYASDENCSCGTGSTAKSCVLGQQCVIEEGSEPQCKAKVPRMECLHSHKCPCWKSSTGSGSKGGSAGQWSPEKPVCDLESKTFTAKTGDFIDLKKSQDLYLEQVIANLKKSGGYKLRQLKELPQISSAAIKI